MKFRTKNVISIRDRFKSLYLQLLMYTRKYKITIGVQYVSTQIHTQIHIEAKTLVKI